jgi:cell division protein FtsZ
VSVLGVGGAGGNVLDALALDGAGEAELVCLNTDARSLKQALAPHKLQLGKPVTRGLGAGGDPEVGREAAVATCGEIDGLVEGREIVFVCAGLGGGTGSGAAPLVVERARAAGAFVVVFAVMPFPFEGRRRRAQADLALEMLSRRANALMTFENARMGELVLPDQGVEAAFAAADAIVGQGIRAVAGIVSRPGMIEIGMDDLIAALRQEDSRCLFGYGEATGSNRAHDALAMALQSPLLDRGALLAEARNVLVHIAGGKSMTLFEIEQLMGELGSQVSPDTHVHFGTAADPALGDKMVVTLISSFASTPENRNHHATGAGARFAAGAGTQPRTHPGLPAPEPAQPADAWDAAPGPESEDGSETGSAPHPAEPATAGALDPTTAGATGPASQGADALADDEADVEDAFARLERELFAAADAAAEEEALRNRSRAAGDRARDDSTTDEEDEVTEVMEIVEVVEVAELVEVVEALEVIETYAVGGPAGELAHTELQAAGPGAEAEPALAADAVDDDGFGEALAGPDTHVAAGSAPDEDYSGVPRDEDDAYVEEDEPALAMVAEEFPEDSYRTEPDPRHGATGNQPRNQARTQAREEGQGMLEFDPAPRGRFDKSTPTVIGGENLDLPTYLRRRPRG